MPQAVVQALGRDFFDQLVVLHYQPTDDQGGPMRTSAAPLPLESGDYIIPADVVKALSQG
jgi:hypothetical protein